MLIKPPLYQKGVLSSFSVDLYQSGPGLAFESKNTPFLCVTDFNPPRKWPGQCISALEVSRADSDISRMDGLGARLLV